MVSPIWAAPWPATGDTVPAFTSDTAGAAAALSIVTVEGVEGGEVALAASAPAAVAESVTFPASTSAWVTICETAPTQVSDAPGARPGESGVGHVTAPSVGSSTATEVRVTLPVLVTV